MQFEDMKESMTQIDLGEFMGFAKDFGVNLSKMKLTEVYKKCSVNHKPHKFEQFLLSIERMAVELNNDKILALRKKVVEVNRLLKKMKQEG